MDGSAFAELFERDLPVGYADDGLNSSSPGCSSPAPVQRATVHRGRRDFRRPVIGVSGSAVPAAAARCAGEYSARALAS